MRIAVLDHGMGNLRSVCKAIEHVAPRASVSLVTLPAEIDRADKLVFPGQGAIGGCLAALNRDGLRDALARAMAGKPFLGICLGLQALYGHSEEGGGAAGLGVLDGTVKRFPGGRDERGNVLKIPHMGWNTVRQVRSHALWDGIEDNARYYFVHSYYADSRKPDVSAGETEYGVRFTAAAARDNLFAVQFHPEKSAQAGLRLLENFARWDGNS
jgi:glutamine amidotransferase